jgi:hypothetical protein
VAAAFGAIVPFHASFRTVTVAPLWVRVPPQICETCWPFANVHARLQPLIA